MAQPNNYGFGEEAAMLKDSARKFFEDNMPVDKLHAMVADDPTPEREPECLWAPDLWQQMVELGWTAVGVPEECGGLGMPLVAMAGLAEELGRAAFPCPLLGTLNATVVLAKAGSGAHGALEQIASGSSATLAITNAQGSWNAGDTDVSFANGTLNGTASFVQDAGKADYFLVVATGEGGISLHWVAADAPGVTVMRDGIVDLTRDQARVRFDGIDSTPMSENALPALNAAMPAVWTLLAADVVGAAEWQLQTTIEYVSVRKQFDKPLGFFQAVKHPLVDVMILIDQSKSLTYNAACAYDIEPETASQCAHMAKAAAADAAGFASSRSVQSHGGIGFTWECFLHLYFKRQKHSQVLWGDAAWHRARLAEILIGPIAA